MNRCIKADKIQDANTGTSTSIGSDRGLDDVSRPNPRIPSHTDTRGESALAEFLPERSDASVHDPPIQLVTSNINLHTVSLGR